jgi:predicted DNA repair protein MutK
MLAMLWVGGGILVHGFSEYGATLPEHVIHAVSEAVRTALPVAGDVAAWLTGATGAAIVGLAAGAVTALVVALVITPFAKTKHSKP